MSAIQATATDEELVAATQGGDRAAFDILVGRWDRKIQGAIYRVMGSHDDAQELAHEAFIKAYRALGRFQSRARFSSWLYQIAINLCRDRLRRRKVRRMVSLDDLGESGPGALTAGGTSVSQAVEDRELAQLVAEAVATLAPEQREVIVLKEYQELTFAEIAEVLELPISTVKTRLYRGLVQLRRRLERRGVKGEARRERTRSRGDGL